MNSIPLKQQQLWPYQKKKHPTPNQPWYCDTKLCRYPSTCKKNQRKGLIKLIKSKCQICLRNITTAKWEKKRDSTYMIPKLYTKCTHIHIPELLLPALYTKPTAESRLLSQFTIHISYYRSLGKHWVLMIGEPSLQLRLSKKNTKCGREIKHFYQEKKIFQKKKEHAFCV